MIVTSYSLVGQKVTVNDDGEKIVQYDDGSWRKYHPSDSIYETKGDSGQNIRLQDSWLEKEENDMPLSQVELLKAAQERINTLSLKTKFERERYQNIQARRIYLEDNYKRAKTNRDNEDPAYLEKLRTELAEAKVKEKQAAKTFKRALKKSKKALDVLHLIPEEQIAWYLKETKNQKPDAHSDQNPLSESSESEKLIIPKVLPIKGSQQPGYFSLDAEPYRDPLIYPPTEQNCIVIESIDDFTGQKRKDTQRAHYFDFSYDRMLPHLKGVPFLQCYANLTNMSGYTFIHLEIIVNNPNASRNFGSIEKDAQITFYLLNGQSITLNNRRTDNGRIDPLKKTTSYIIQLAIDKAVEKELKNGLVDQMRIVWSKGYEEYQIYNMDFFRQQIKCLRDGSRVK